MKHLTKTILTALVGALLTILFYRVRLTKESELLAKIDILSGRRPL